MDRFILTDDAFFTRAILGLVIATGIAFAARRAHALTRGGAIAAALIGTIGVAAGWSWGVLLIAFFSSSTLLSRFRRDDKAHRTAAVVAKDDERDVLQVLANGAIFAVAAVMYKSRWVLAPGAVDDYPAWTSAWSVLGAGAIAAACADTWSTEIGTLARDAPRMITTWRGVPAGTSGGVTALGLAATASGAAFMGLVTWLVGWPAAIAIAAAGGGIVGALADSFIGALAQSRRRCPRCDAATERDVHGCGTATVDAGGIAWLDNDGVNAFCTGIGALAAFLVWRVLV